MPVQRRPLSEADVNRKRKTHRKSRAGCGNCKLRRVKCDELRPNCRQCVSYGVTCNYDSKSPDLQFTGTNTFTIVKTSRPRAPSLNQTVLGMVNAQLAAHPDAAPSGLPIYELKQEDLALLSRFQKRTALTIGTESGTDVYVHEVVKLAFGAPYLMHVILTMSLRHDRFLDVSTETAPSTAEAFHWYQGTSLFNKVLSQPIRNSDRDSLWATAALLGALAFSCLETKRPEAAWPLRPPSDSDLEWLKMSDGKKAVWNMTNPTREDSIFHYLKDMISDDISPSDAIGPELSSLPLDFLKLYNLHEFSDEFNPYLGAVSVLAQLMDIECNHRTILKFLAFVSKVHPEYRRLLEMKDPRALLVLAYWYAKCCQYHQWWIWRRSVMECQATCLYLERYYAHETQIMKLLEYPKMMCGLFT